MANRSGCGEWYHKKCMSIQIKVFCDKKYQMLCLQKINYVNYATHIMKIRGLSVEDLRGEIQHFQKLGCENIFLAQPQKFMSVKLPLFCAFLSSQNFPIL